MTLTNDEENEVISAGQQIQKFILDNYMGVISKVSAHVARDYKFKSGRRMGEVFKTRER